MSEDALERAVIRKFLYRAAGFDEDEAVPDDYQLVDAVDDAIERLEKLEELEERVDKAEMAAQSAIGVARAEGVADGGAPPKKEQAKITARNEVVKSALLDRSTSDGGNVTVGDVQTMLRPELEVAYQSVKDAFNELAEQWGAFEVGENESGNRALKATKAGLSEELVGAVEMDLGRDDLTKRLISRGG